MWVWVWVCVCPLRVCARLPCLVTGVCAWACLDLRIFILHGSSSAVCRFIARHPPPSRPWPIRQGPAGRRMHSTQSYANATLSNRFVKWPRGQQWAVVKRRYAADAARRPRPPLCRSKHRAAGPWRASAGVEWCMRMLRWDDGALLPWPVCRVGLGV